MAVYKLNEEKWVQVDKSDSADDEYKYSGNGGRSWVTKDSKFIDTWDSEEEAREDGRRTFKKDSKWDVEKLTEDTVSKSNSKLTNRGEGKSMKIKRESLHESYDDSLYVDIDELIGTLGRALEEGTRDPDVFAELADVYGRLVEMRDAGYQLNTVQDESLKESRLGEGNPVSHELPSSIDLFLQDVAQTTGQISYNDIVKFAESGFTSEDLKALKKLHRVYADDTSWEDDNDDLVLNDVGRKVAMIVKKKDENCHIVNL